MKIKRILSAALATVVSGTTFASCSQTNLDALIPFNEEKVSTYTSEVKGSALTLYVDVNAKDGGDGSEYKNGAYVTTVEGGEVVEHDPETNDVEGDGETWYVGETFRAVEAPSYGGKAYEPASNNYTDAFVLTEADDGRVIDLNYTRTELPESTTILVNHYFRTITNITREETETVTTSRQHSLIWLFLCSFR